MAYLLLEALRRAAVGSVADWQLASARRYVAVGLSSCPFGFSSLDGFDDLLCRKQAVERVLHLKQFG